jgi:serine/threonine protein kinase
LYYVDADLALLLFIDTFEQYVPDKEGGDGNWGPKDPMALYERILAGKLRMPSHLSECTSARDLIKRLVTPDLTRRLGNLAGGSADVFNHPWFVEVDWPRLYRRVCGACTRGVVGTCG